MIAVGKKGSYRWNNDGTLLIMLPAGNFMWQTKRRWMDSEVHQRIGVDLNDYSVRVMCEGDHLSDDPWYMQDAVVLPGATLCCTSATRKRCPRAKCRPKAKRFCSRLWSP